MDKQRKIDIANAVEDMAIEVYKLAEVDDDIMDKLLEISDYINKLIMSKEWD